jgi:hypothetical protein
VRPRQRWGELEPDDFACHYRCRVHDTGVRNESERNKSVRRTCKPVQPRSVM